MIKLESTKGRLTFDVPEVIFNCKKFEVNASSDVHIDTPKYVKDGGKSDINHVVTVSKDVTNNAKTTFNGMFTANAPSNFLANAKFNALSGTLPAPGPAPHSHLLL